MIVENGYIPTALIDEQIDWFYNDIGLDDVYFQLENINYVARMTTSLYAAKMAAFPDEDKRQEIRSDMEAPDHAIYINISEPGLSNITGLRYEHKDRVLLRHSSWQTPMNR